MKKYIELIPGPILIIGASGFIGSNLLRQIVEVRSDVVGTVFSGDSWRLEGIPSVNIHYCNINDKTHLHTLLNKIGPQTIFDCSSFGAYSFEHDYERIHETNYLSLAHQLEILSDMDISAYVHAGSSSEYGMNAAGPAEDTPLSPNSHYAVSKGAASLLIDYYGKIKSLPAVNLRLYSVYGAYEDSSRLIPALCLESLKGKLPPFAKPSTSRDFVYIDDVTRAFYLAAIKMDESLYGESFNIGNGKQVTLKDLAELANSVFNLNQTPVYSSSEARAWDVDAWYANPKKANELLGWKAETPLSDGLVSTLEWWKEITKKRSRPSLSKKNIATKGKNSITAVVACYKDGQAIPIMYERLVETFTKLKIDYEIIFVNDCSPDDSTEVIQELSAKDPCVIGITHSRNFGSQAAFRSGMELATKEAVVLLDGDLQDPPAVIEDFVREWRKGADIVYGKRVKREMPAWLEMCYKGFYRVFAAMSEIPIPKDAGDFSLIDRSAVHWLLECNERDAFLRGLRAYVGFKQVAVKYVRPERMFGVSTNNLIKNIGWAKKGIFSFTRVPLHALTAIGAATFVGTIVLGLWVLCAKLITPESSPTGITFLSLMIMFFGSMTMLSCGILGEYVGKILEETKARPHFIRREIIVRGKRQALTPKKEVKRRA